MYQHFLLRNFSAKKPEAGPFITWFYTAQCTFGVYSAQRMTPIFDFSRAQFSRTKDQDPSGEKLLFG